MDREVIPPKRIVSPTDGPDFHGKRPLVYVLSRADCQMFLFTRRIRKYSTRRKDPFEEDNRIQVNKEVLSLIF